MVGSILESRTSGSNPDIIVKQVFSVIKGSGYFSYTLDHNGKDINLTDRTNDFDVLAEQAKKKLASKYDNYMDYADNASKTRLESNVSNDLLPTFGKDTLNMTRDQGQEMRKKIDAAGAQGNLMWKTVISFSDDFLIEQGILSDKIERHLDQRKLKSVIQKHMTEYLKDEGIGNSAEWFGNIHLFGDQNKEHIHVHLGIFEPGKTARPDKFNPKTNQIEPRGVFKQKTLDRFKASLWRDLRRDDNREKMLLQQMAQDKSKKALIAEFETLLASKKQRDLMAALLKALPDNQKHWRAKSNATDMMSAKKAAKELVTQFLKTDGREDYQSFLTATKGRQQQYMDAYGADNDKAKEYVATKQAELENRLINGLFRQIKDLSPEDFEQTKLGVISEESIQENHQAIDDLEQKLSDIQIKKSSVNNPSASQNHSRVNKQSVNDELNVTGKEIEDILGWRAEANVRAQIARTQIYDSVSEQINERLTELTNFQKQAQQLANNVDNSTVPEVPKWLLNENNVMFLNKLREQQASRLEFFQSLNNKNSITANERITKESYRQYIYGEKFTNNIFIMTKDDFVRLAGKKDAQDMFPDRLQQTDIEHVDDEAIQILYGMNKLELSDLIDQQTLYLQAGQTLQKLEQQRRSEDVEDKGPIFKAMSFQYREISRLRDSYFLNMETMHPRVKQDMVNPKDIAAHYAHSFDQPEVMPPDGVELGPKTRTQQGEDASYMNRYPKGSRLKRPSFGKLSRGMQQDLRQSRRSEERAMSAYERDQQQMRYEAEREAYEHGR